MSADDFWNTVLDPEQRTPMQLNIADNESGGQTQLHIVR